MNKHTNRIGTALLVAIMKGKHTWTTRLPPLIHDGGGLYLQPREGGGGTWKYRYTRNGKPSFTGFGRLEDVSATEARRQRDVFRAKLVAGGDPVRERQREVAVERVNCNLGTFRLAADQWKALRLRSWTPKRGEEMVGILNNHVLPALGDLAVTDIMASHIVRLLADMKSSTTTNQRVMQIIKEVIDQAFNDLPEKDQPPNPADSSRLQRTLRINKITGGKSKPHAKMALADVPAFVARLWEKKSVSGLGMMTIILSGLRASEALHAKWHEIQGDVWTIAGDGDGEVGRMKAKEGLARAQYVPITPGLKRVFDTLRPVRRATDDYIFPGLKGGPITVGTMYDVLKDYGARGVTTHGFRSTLIDFLRSKGVPVDVRETVLHHKVGGVRGHYDYDGGHDDNRLADRIEPMKAWSAYCLSAIPAEQRHLRVVA